MPNKLGRRLRALRIAVDLKQVSIAAALGVTQAAVSRIEQGKLEPSADLKNKVLVVMAALTKIVHKSQT
jgi:transcriptional regulator with XRE-family HTH domain